METHRQVLDDIIEVVWGNPLQEQIFERWSQGFVFSSDEATALQQYCGGPCGVIAPVQALLLKNIIPHYTMEQLKQLSSTAVDQYLAASLTEILCLCATEAAREQPLEHKHNAASAESEVAASIRLRVVYLSHDRPTPTPGEECSELSEDPPPPLSPSDHTWFHSHLRIREFTSSGDLLEFTKNHLSDFKSKYGVLLFLYSALVTRGVTCAGLASEGGGVEGVCEPLISGGEGHGEQPLLNLLITGTPSAHVFDGAQDVSGFKLNGVWSRPRVGLLHLQEYYRQLKVGWYLKNPQHPVWLCASQEHITVVFSPCRELVCPESAIERGQQVFSWYDTEGNNFIQRDQLKAVLQHLDLCTDDEFVKFMCSELDPEAMGVILYSRFQEAFFSGEQLHTAPDTFTLYHYNGLIASNPDKKVQYAKGYVTRQESLVSYNAVQDLTACLSTKWPNIELQWETNFTPSMN